MCLALIVGLLFFSGGTQASDSEFELGICERAYMVCFAVNLHPSGDILKCFAGYAFCKDFVEPLIK